MSQKRSGCSWDLAGGLLAQTQQRKGPSSQPPSKDKTYLSRKRAKRRSEIVIHAFNDQKRVKVKKSEADKRWSPTYRKKRKVEKSDSGPCQSGKIVAIPIGKVSKGQWPMSKDLNKPARII
jgi:hypothetical protein